jgi:hypothetical protein
VLIIKQNANATSLLNPKTACEKQAGLVETANFDLNLLLLISKPDSFVSNFLITSDKGVSLKANKMKSQLVLKLSTSMELQ